MLGETSAPWGSGGVQRGSKPELWSNICKGSCSFQMIGGVFLALLSTTYLFDYMMTTGVIIGGLLFVIGGIGLIGAFKQSKDFLNFHIVGAILTIVLSFQFTGQVWREVEVDCALAELYLKSNAVEEVTRKTAQNEMFDTIYNRINQMEDMLTMVHDGVKKSTSLLSEGGPIADIADDRDFFHSKLGVLHRHATSIRKEIMENPKITQAKVEQWSPEHRKALDEKFAAAEKVLKRIDEHYSTGGKDINAAEYEELLHAVTAAFLTPTEPGERTDKDTTELAEAHDDLPDTQSSITRLQSAIKDLDELSQKNDQLSAQMKDRRAHWNTEYIKILQRSRQNQRTAHVNTLESMPEHCIKEHTGIEYMGFGGLGVAFSQLISIYFTLCLQFRIPLKAE